MISRCCIAACTTLALLIFALDSAQAADTQVIVGSDQPNPGDAAPGELNAPFAVDFDADGAMIIVEYDGGRLLRWTPSEGLRVLAGASQAGYVDGPAADARFNQLHNLAIAADGRIFLSDHLNHAVRVYDPRTETVDSYAGNGEQGFDGDRGTIADARFRQPICVSLTPDRQHLLVADIGNRRVRRIELASGHVQTLAGNGQRGVPRDGSAASEQPLVDPRAPAAATDDIWYLVERGGHALRKIENGRITTVAGNAKAGFRDGPALQAQFDGPKHLDVAEDGRVFIADDNNHAVRVYDPASGTVETVSTAPYTLRRPHGVKVFQGELYIADSYHHRILKRALPVADKEGR